jgi:hypothetical protein
MPTIAITESEKFNLDPSSSQLSQGPAYGFGHRPQFVHKLFKLVWTQALGAIGKGNLGIGMDFDDKTIGSSSDCSATDRRYVFALAGSVARINYDRKMAQRLEHRYSIYVQSIPCVSLKGPDAALAEYDSRIVMTKDIFRCV